MCTGRRDTNKESLNIIDNLGIYNRLYNFAHIYITGRSWKLAVSIIKWMTDTKTAHVVVTYFSAEKQAWKYNSVH